MSTSFTRRGFLGALGLGGSSLIMGLSACGNTQQAETKTEQKTEAKPAIDNPSVDVHKVYVDAAWVKDLIDGKLPESANYALLECSWGEESDSKAYTGGHIKGAVHMNTDNVESDQYWNYRSPEEFKDLFSKFGITKDTVVVCYGAKAVDAADDRVALGFLWAGVENVKCLDGGLDAWTKAGYGTETTSNAPQSTNADFGVTIPAHPEYIMSIDDAIKESEAGTVKLVSIRSYAEFEGKTSGYSYIDRAGEPKGAIWGHDTDDGSYATADGLTVGKDKLAEYLKESDASLDDHLAFYCGTGWRAAIPFLIMYQEGYSNMVLYDGGWFQWQMNPDLPVQVGDPKTGNVEYTTVSTLPTDKAVKK